MVGFSREYRLLIPVIPFLAFLYMFYQIGLIFPFGGHTQAFTPSRSLIDECVLRIGAMGITLIAALSGFGSICAVWETYMVQHMCVLDVLC